jgi:hypothetical protein
MRVFKDRLLRKIFGSKRVGVTGGRTKLQNKEFYELYSLPNFVPVIKSRAMK